MNAATGGVLMTSMLAVAVPAKPKTSVTVSVAVNVPGVAYSCVALTPSLSSIAEIPGIGQDIRGRGIGDVGIGSGGASNATVNGTGPVDGVGVNAAPVLH